ncbi:aminomethyltransferase, mitochondrial-like [Tubulanus polymorphus]|uniref:aminomethyltransferase, mitochondrial-like n=1 Tax=Tubulanus polymorphus TaxID=672921 RepID=UPI003DA416F2
MYLLKMQRNVLSLLQQAVTSRTALTSDVITSCRYFASKADLKKTCLYDFHVSQGGKMVPFAGYLMPVQYKDSLIISHEHCRNKAVIFDVSHMLQTKVTGKNRIEFMESLTVADVEGLKDNQGTLSLFTRDNGGINDDLIITKTNEDYLYVVSNAACADKDFNNMKAKESEMIGKGLDVNVEKINMALLALQGPGMVKALQPLVETDLSKLYFMTSVITTLCGIKNCRVTRCGYTGEDGVELSVPEDKAAEICEILLSSKTMDVKLAGLGPRDSLRLEAGLCLYGNDIDENTTPIEGTLAWTIGKRRRKTADFPGAQIILEQLKNKPTKKRVGFVSTSGAPARGGAVIFDESGEKEIGKITSGSPSPTLKTNISMGYIETPFSKNNTKVQIKVRNKLVQATVSKMPFVAASYYQPPKN